MLFRRAKAAASSKEFSSFAKAFSQAGGLPIVFKSSRSTFSQSQDQATSWAVLQCFGSNDRNEASMQDLYSGSFTLPDVTLAIRRTRTSHSSVRRAELATFFTMLSKQARTSFIQTLFPKPMTAALKRNISLYVLGTPWTDSSLSDFFPGELTRSLSPMSSLIVVALLHGKRLFFFCLLLLGSSAAFSSCCSSASSSSSKEPN
mmetsp:Transcript_45939/g.99794  ORF Transcript_45939/g.99794 Transcript_45939/m.99794 type:complete len:203 (-) Transcript_45939:753-1361(-)